MRLIGRLGRVLKAPVSLRTPGGKALAGTALVVFVLGFAAVWFITQNGQPVYQPKSRPVIAPSVVPSTRVTTAPPGGTVIPAGRTAGNIPVEITIPVLGVNAPVVPAYDPGGVLQPPPLTGAGANDVGWWAGMPGNPQGSYSPGQKGPAALIGHINSSAIGDLVFAHLRECGPSVPQPCMKLGDSVTITLANNTRVRFVMLQHMQEIRKAVWDCTKVGYNPVDDYTCTQDDVALASQTTNAVYGGSPVPVLRLITCGGPFDYSRGHYRDNIIAYLTEE